MTTVALSNVPAAGQKSHWQRVVTRNGWVIGVWLLLGILIFWYSHLVPRFGSFQIASITKNSLPLVYLALGQALIVIAGGIDLSLGPLLLLSNVMAARFMHDQPFAIVLLIGIGILILLGLLNGGVGYIIHISGVPDIVVTLATSYIWSGVALMILPSPGGGTAPEFRWIFTGSTVGIGGSYLVPLVMIIIPTLIVYFFAQRSALGLSIYAIGSSHVAARLAGLNVRRAKIASYAVGGMMAALAGLATVALTGAGDPRFSIGANATLNSIAAIVLGGIALTGGVGSVFGVVATSVMLIMLNPILSAMGINADPAQVIQGGLIAGVMVIGGLVTLYRERSS